MKNSIKYQQSWATSIKLGLIEISQIEEYNLLMNFLFGRICSETIRPPTEEKTFFTAIPSYSSLNERYEHTLAVFLLRPFLFITALVFLWDEAIALALE